MRIIFFDFVTQYAGKPRLTLDLIDRMRDRIAFTVLDPYGICEEYVESMRRRQIDYDVLMPGATRTQVGHKGNAWRRRLGFVAGAPSLIRLKRRLSLALTHHNPDLVWTSSLKGAALILRSIGRRPLPVAFHYRRTWRPEMARGWRGRVFSDSRVMIICESQTNRLNLVRFGVPEERTSVIPNAIDAAAIRGASAGSLHGAIPQLNRPIRVLLAGTLDSRKGHLCAVRALGRLVAHGNDAALYIPGNERDSRAREYVQNINQLAAALKVRDRIVYIGWRRDMPQVMSNMTVACLPSVDEGLPLSLMEGMAVGCPVISTSVGGIPDLIQSEITGWLHNVDDHKALGDAICMAHQNPLRECVIQKAYDHLVKYFSPQRQIDMATDSFKQTMKINAFDR